MSLPWFLSFLSKSRHVFNDHFPTKQKSQRLVAGVQSPSASSGPIANLGHLVEPGQSHSSPQPGRQVLGEKAFALERIWAFGSDTLQPVLFILFFLVQVPFNQHIIGEGQCLQRKFCILSDNIVFFRVFKALFQSPCLWTPSLFLFLPVSPPVLYGTQGRRRRR